MIRPLQFVDMQHVGYIVVCCCGIDIVSAGSKAHEALTPFWIIDNITGRDDDDYREEEWFE